MSWTDSRKCYVTEKKLTCKWMNASVHLTERKKNNLIFNFVSLKKKIIFSNFFPLKFSFTEVDKICDTSCTPFACNVLPNLIFPYFWQWICKQLWSWQKSSEFYLFLLLWSIMLVHFSLFMCIIVCMKSGIMYTTLINNFK